MKNQPTNPFMQGIMPKLDLIDFAKRISKKPSFLNSELPKDVNARKALLKQINLEWFHVSPLSYEIYECFDDIIRTRYNCIDVRSFNEILNNIYEWNDHSKDSNYIPKSIFNRTIDGFTIIGPSGLGKTLTVNTILENFFPQVIKHEYFSQLVYLKVNCSSIGSTKSLCFQILHEFDNLLETKYFKKYSSTVFSAEKLIPIIADLAHLHRLGALIIDEVNHLADAKGINKNQIIGFLKNLNQAIALPIVYIGTPEALPVLAGNLQIARRTQGIQSIMWDRYDEDQKEWALFLKSLWKNQVLLAPGDLSKQCAKAYYRFSQGVVDIVIKLHINAQKRALTKGFETIDEALLEAVAKDYFALTTPMINAIYSKNSFLISQYRDISMGNLRIVKEITKNGSEVAGPDELTRIFNRDFSSEEIQYCMKLLLEKNPSLKLKDLVDQAKSTLEKVESTTPKKKRTGRPPEGKLPGSVKTSITETHADLVEKGFVKSVDSLIPN